MHLLGIDLQQVSIASLIIALGLLVDDPVVAGDAIKRELDGGTAADHRRLARAHQAGAGRSSSRRSPTSSRTCRSCCSRATPGGSSTACRSCSPARWSRRAIVSMTFIPLLGYYLLRPSRKPTAPIEERRRTGFTGWYYRVGSWAIEHRWRVAVASLGVLALGGWIMSRLKPQFFPKDLQYLSYVDVWLPEDAPLSATRAVTDAGGDRDPAARARVLRAPRRASTAKAGWSRSPRSSAAAARGSGSRSAPSRSSPTTRRSSCR